jgi:hypothetical protein
MSRETTQYDWKDSAFPERTRSRLLAWTMVRVAMRLILIGLALLRSHARGLVSDSVVVSHWQAQALQNVMLTV